MMSTSSICDFCSDPELRYIYPCRRFVCAYDDVTTVSEGGWTACDDCADLIERDRRAELYVRAIGAQRERHPLLRDPSLMGSIARRVSTLQSSFFEHRDGARRPL